MHRIEPGMRHRLVIDGNGEGREDRQEPRRLGGRFEAPHQRHQPMERDRLRSHEAQPTPTEHWPAIGRNSRAYSLPMNSRSNASERSFECPDAIGNGTKASTQEGA